MDADPEGARTIARTLLETVCKRVLYHTETPYNDKDDLPALYRAVAMKLNFAPSQHTEANIQAYTRWRYGRVEGLGSLRNKIGDAHGRGKNGSAPERASRAARGEHGRYDGYVHRRNVEEGMTAPLQLPTTYRDVFT